MLQLFTMHLLGGLVASAAFVQAAHAWIACYCLKLMLPELQLHADAVQNKFLPCAVQTVAAAIHNACALWKGIRAVV